MKAVSENRLRLSIKYIGYIKENFGYVEAVECMTEYLLKYGDELLKVCPVELLEVARPAVAEANRRLAMTEEEKQIERIKVIFEEVPAKDYKKEEVQEVEEVEEEPTAEPADKEAVAERINEQLVIRALTNGVGTGALRAMIGASNFYTGREFGFSFKGCRKANNCIIRYDHSKDLFIMEIGKHGTKNHIPYYTPVAIYTDLYLEDLKSTFEELTGLYTTL